MASRYDTQFFQNMSNTQITNLEITHTSGNVYNNTSERNELDRLRSKISVAALHNSGERYDAPRCHPGTRVDIQDDIMKWLDDVDDPELVLWMYGSPGVGKSAIAQAIATLCYGSEPRRLAGAFFLSRTAPSESGRGDEKRLAATIAYQMAMNIPSLGRHITTAIAKNGLIFDLDLDVQIKELILDPLTALSNEMSNQTPPMIFVLDALDECSSTSSQARIIKAFVAIIGKIPHNIPRKLLVASRPESNIKSIFAAPEISPVVRPVSLDEKYQAHDDIRKFLVDGFNRFRETHPSPGIFHPNWPTDDDIKTLVWRSSGQFIYASTVQKYIQEEHANPILRLQSLLDLAKVPINRPFAELDALYTHIFQQLKDVDIVLYIMCIRRCCRKWSETVTITFCESLLGLPKGGGTLSLQGLSSVIKVDNDELKAYHASLDDFLNDKVRSGDFYIYADKICTHLFCLALKYMPQLHSYNEPNLAERQMACSLMVARTCTEYIEGQHTEIHEILATFDLEIIFQCLRSTESKSGYLIIFACGELLEWLFKEHQVLIQSSNMTLLPVFSQLQKWTMGQFKRFRFDKPAASWYATMPFGIDVLKHISCRESENYLDAFFNVDAEMTVFLIGLGFGTWVTGSAPQILTEDRIGQLMLQCCYYIRNSPWLNLIRNAPLNIDFINTHTTVDLIQYGENNLLMHYWTSIFNNHIPPLIDQYLEVQYILGLNSSISTPDAMEKAMEIGGPFGTLIFMLYFYLKKVEKAFPWLLSPLNALEEGTSTAAEQALDREALLPYTPHSSDSPSFALSPAFALALAFHKIEHIQYQDTELGLPVV